MKAATTHDKLIRLHDLILEERACARQLDMEGLQAVVEEKAGLLDLLLHVGDIAPQDRELAARIRRENRRNAFLFKTTLGWIRETMEFFGKRTVTSTYSAHAGTVQAQINGRLLSGKV